MAKKPKCCYLCQWAHAVEQPPKKWVMCRKCYHTFQASMVHDTFRADCLKLYQYVYAAGQNRKDANEDRAERFLAFLMSGNNPPTERMIEAICENVKHYQEIKDERKQIFQSSIRRSSARGIFTRNPFARGTRD